MLPSGECSFQRHTYNRLQNFSVRFQCFSRRNNEKLHKIYRLKLTRHSKKCLWHLHQVCLLLPVPVTEFIKKAWTILKFQCTVRPAPAIRANKGRFGLNARNPGQVIWADSVQARSKMLNLEDITNSKYDFVHLVHLSLHLKFSSFNMICLALNFALLPCK